MKEVALTVGPRGAGKSTLCKKIAKAHPDIVLISLDDILADMYGQRAIAQYSDESLLVKDKMFDMLAENLDRKGNVRIMLDCWNKDAEARKVLTERIRFLGADIISAWYFVTPEDLCVNWFIEREEDAVPPEHRDVEWKKLRIDIAMDSCRKKYQDYHTEWVDHDQGFNFIKEINPLRLPCFTQLFTASDRNY